MSWRQDLKSSPDESPDVCLLLEGTYPYVKGGVSSWVHGLLLGLPDIRFSAVFLGSSRDQYPSTPLYQLPKNLVHLEAHYLFEETRAKRARPMRQSDQDLHRIRSLHTEFSQRPIKSEELVELKSYLDLKSPLSEPSFLNGEASWRFISEMYEERSTEPSFLDYFWTVRNLHRPIWHLAKLATTIPSARIYHSVSTGYAGLLGTFLSKEQKRPFILTEHGIYTKERRIDLMNADWIRDNRNIFQRDPTDVSYLRELWVRFFETAGKLAYTSADQVISLYENARQQQIADGSLPERSHVIPNGIDTKSFSRSRRIHGAPPPVLCLLGRIVAIKDIKTFVRAAQIVSDRIPESEAWVVGPEDEDPDYAEECHNLAVTLGLGRQLCFLGYQSPAEIFSQIGVLVVSSISEGLPLVVLEAFAAGIPVVTTAVGACPELINGRPGKDAELGRAGRLVGIADPLALSQACIELLTDSTAWHTASQAAMARVESYYTRELMLRSIRTSYEQAWRRD